MKSKLVIIGGDDFQTNGDTVVYENENSTDAETGQLVQRTVPRMIQTGDGTRSTGDPNFTQDGSLTDSYISLESTASWAISPAGLTDVKGNPYYGVQMQGIEHVVLRLSNAGPANFMIDDTAVCSGSGSAQHCTENSGPLAAPQVEVYGGTQQRQLHGRWHRRPDQDRRRRRQRRDDRQSRRRAT